MKKFLTENNRRTITDGRSEQIICRGRFAPKKQFLLLLPVGDHDPAGGAEDNVLAADVGLNTVDGEPLAQQARELAHPRQSTLEFNLKLCSYLYCFLNITIN